MGSGWRHRLAKWFLWILQGLVGAAAGSFVSQFCAVVVSRWPMNEYDMYSVLKYAAAEGAIVGAMLGCWARRWALLGALVGCSVGFGVVWKAAWSSAHPLPSLPWHGSAPLWGAVAGALVGLLLTLYLPKAHRRYL